MGRRRIALGLTATLVASGCTERPAPGESEGGSTDAVSSTGEPDGTTSSTSSASSTSSTTTTTTTTTATTATSSTGGPTTGDPSSSAGDPSTTGPDPTTTSTTTGDPSSGSTGGSGLEISLELTSVQILCPDEPLADPVEASWVVTLDNSEGDAPAMVSTVGVSLGYSWFIESTFSIDVTVAPDEELVVGAGEVVEFPQMKITSLDLDDVSQFCSECEVKDPGVSLHIDYLVDGEEVDASAFPAADLPAICQ